ncbi:hypothetical protein D9M71_518190 [compost metagenome]
MECQWWMGPMIEGYDFPHKNNVVAALVAVAGAALEACGTITQQRNVTGPPLERKPLELIDASLGKTVGHRLLIGCQHVHGEILTFHECRQAPGGLGQAPEHHGRLQGHRIETTGCQSHVPTFGVPGGDNGNAGGEGAQRVAELPAINNHI